MASSTDPSDSPGSTLPPPGVWSPRFARWTGAAALALFLFDVVFGAVVFFQLLPFGDAPVEVGNHHIIDGSFLQRFVSAAAVAGCTVGIGVLIVGGWLAAIEVRGRQYLRADLQAKIQLEVADLDGASTLKVMSFDGNVLASAIDAGVKVVQAGANLPATIATLFAGTLLVLGSLAAGASLAWGPSGNDSTPTDYQTSTPAPTVTVTATPVPTVTVTATATPAR
jgi:hypothetical protein